MSIALTCSFDTLFRVIGHVFNQNKPCLLRGKHGIGKSEIVYQLAQRLFWDEKTKKTVFIPFDQKTPKDVELGLPVIERRVSQMTEGDLIGLPVIKGETTSFNPPDWFKRACNEPCVLFADEIDRGTIEVRQGLFEMTDSRKLNGHYLHTGTIIIAAVNGGKWASQYQVGEMDPAELDRWSVFDLEPEVEDWLKWAKTKDKDGNKNIDQFIINFINDNRSHLEHDGEYEPHKKYPSRRSWKRCSDCLGGGKYFDEFHPDITILATAFVGTEAAISLGDYVKNHKKLVVPKDIIVDGKFELVQDFIINEHVALIDKIEQQELLKKTLDKKELQNFGRYFVMVPSECSAKLLQVLAESGNNDNLINVMKTEVNGKKINLHFVELMSSQAQLKEEEEEILEKK